MIDYFAAKLDLFAATCPNAPNFFGLPTWYKYLRGGGGTAGQCNLEFTFPTDIPLILLAVLDILLRVIGIVAIGYVVFGGAKYVVSQGEPDKIVTAKATILNALIGLVVATLAVSIITFIGGRIN